MFLQSPTAPDDVYALRNWLRQDLLTTEIYRSYYREDCKEAFESAEKVSE